MFILEECYLLGLGTQKRKNKSKTPKHLTHTVIRMAPKKLSPLSTLMPLGLPSHTTDSASVPTLLHINSFLPISLQVN